MNIFISNLDYSITEEELRDLVAPFGQVNSVKIIVDRERGNRSKGFGFVEMASDDEGNALIEGLNNQEIHGKALRVAVAKPREEGSSGGSFNRNRTGGGGFGGGQNRGGSGFRSNNNNHGGSSYGKKSNHRGGYDHDRRNFSDDFSI